MHKPRQPAPSTVPALGDAANVKRRPLLRRAVPALLLPTLAAGLQLADAAPVPGEPATVTPGRGGTTVSFMINVPQSVLDDLRARLARTRWPDEVDSAGWAYGANRGYLQALADRWQHGYDWRAEEAKLNRFAPACCMEVACGGAGRGDVGSSALT